MPEELIARALEQADEMRIAVGDRAVVRQRHRSFAHRFDHQAIEPVG